MQTHTNHARARTYLSEPPEATRPRLGRPAPSRGPAAAADHAAASALRASCASPPGPVAPGSLPATSDARRRDRRRLGRFWVGGSAIPEWRALEASGGALAPSRGVGEQVGLRNGGEKGKGTGRCPVARWQTEGVGGIREDQATRAREEQGPKEANGDAVR